MYLCKCCRGILCTATGALNTVPGMNTKVSHWKLDRKRKVSSSWRNVDSDEAALTEEGKPFHALATGNARSPTVERFVGATIHVSVSSSTIDIATTVTDLSVIPNGQLVIMATHITSVCRSGSVQLRPMRLVQYVHCELSWQDYCNSLGVDVHLKRFRLNRFSAWHKIETV